MELSFPGRISWWVDLEKPSEDRWARGVWRKLRSVEASYSAQVEQELLESNTLSELFVPIYEKFVMSKPDYRLDKERFYASIKRMEADPSYRLMWFRDRETGQGLGGNVIHLYPERVMTAYRSYDHDLTKSRGMKYFDYYADYQLQEYVKRLGVAVLGRGKMGHPCKSLGLSMFKVRAGAVVKVASDEPVWVLSEKEIRAWLERWGMLAWYSEPDREGRYRALNVWTRQVSSELEKEIDKTFGRVGIAVRIEKK